jgi:phosphosulfolactate phosphohydrolase-like enzyme
MLIDRISRQNDRSADLDDGARTALEVFRGRRRRALAVLRDADHGRRLTELGFERDLELACEVDRFSFAPVLRDGCLVAEGVPAAS